MNADKIKTVRGYVLEGNQLQDIEEKIRADWPSEDPAALIEAVLSGFTKTGTQSKEVIEGFCIDAARDLYRRMLAVGDFAGALSAIKEIARLRQKSGTKQDEDFDALLSGLTAEPEETPIRTPKKPKRKKHEKRKAKTDMD